MKRVEFLYPELSYIYAEGYNMEFLQKSSSEIEVLRTTHKDVPHFVSEDIDMIFMGSMTEKGQEFAIKLLEPYKARIQELISKGTVFLITGNSIEVFGKYIEDGEKKVEALGIFDFYAKRQMNKRYDSQFSAMFGDLAIVGHKSQYSFAYGEFKNSFMTVTRGVGMNKETKLEGIHKNNFFATYSIGPFLVLNPLFTKHIMELIGVEPNIAFENEAIAAYESRLKSVSNISDK